MEPLPVAPVSTIPESGVEPSLHKESAFDTISSNFLKNDVNESKESSGIKRSMSEIAESNGTTKKTLQTSESFPSLSDHVLRKLGLWLEEKQPAVSSAEEQSEKEIENSFMALLLAFQTDRLTLKTRLELQTYSRDQAEKNMVNEIQHLQNIVMNLCDQSDYLTDFQKQIDTLHNAALRISRAAEIYGAVQQESRLSKAVDVILLHVDNLKQAYQKELSNHDETKRILSESKPASISQTSIKPSCKRRATIAVGVAQNGTNIMPSEYPSEVKLASAAGRIRPGLTQRFSAGRLETLIANEKLIDMKLENKVERRSSLIPSLIPSRSDDSNCSHLVCNNVVQSESDVGEDSDGSIIQEPPPNPLSLSNKDSFQISFHFPRISVSTEDLILHFRYGLAAALLVAAIAVFCSTLYM